MGTILLITHRDGTGLIDLLFHATQEPYTQTHEMVVQKYHFDCAQPVAPKEQRVTKEDSSPIYKLNRKITGVCSIKPM